MEKEQIKQNKEDLETTSKKQSKNISWDTKLTFLHP